VKPQVSLAIGQSIASVSPPTVQAGDIVTVSVQVTNAAQSSGINVATAFLLNLTIPVNRTYCELLSSSLVSADGQIISGSLSTDSVVQLFFPAMAEGGKFTVTYKYLLLNTVTPNLVVSLVPLLEWTSSNQTLYGSGGQYQSATSASTVTIGMHQHTVVWTAQSLYGFETSLSRFSFLLLLLLLLFLSRVELS
jgi:hypothetical protein